MRPPLRLLLAALLLCAIPEAGAATAVQSAGRDAGTATSASLAFPLANSAGNFIAVAVRAGGTGQSITVGDSRGNVYRRALEASLALDPVTVALYYAESAAVGPNTVTVSVSQAGGSLRFAIVEYSGVASSNALDSASLVAEGTGGSAVTPSIATSRGGDLVLGIFSTAGAATLTPVGRLSGRAQVPAAPSTRLALFDRTQAFVGATTVSATIAPSQAWAAAIVAFKPPASGAAALGAWTAVQNWPVVAVHASLLPTGDVLAWTDYTTNAGAQLWKRSTNTFVPKTYSPVSLFCAGHAFLPDGRLMVTGGIVGTQDDLGPYETTIFDPVTESWSAGPLMEQGRYYPTTTTLPDGRILVAGGTTVCSSCYAEEVEIYDPATGVWAPMAASAQHTFKYYPHLYVLPDGRVLLAGQDDKPVATEVLDLATQTWSTVDARVLEGHSSAMYLPGKLMKCGKATADAEGYPAVATTYVLDMTAPSPAWQATAPMAFPRSYHNLTILPDGQVLVTGGGRTTDKANYGTAVYAAELWNPATKTWTTMSSAQRPRLYHSSALLLPDATVLVAGGGRRNGRSQPDPLDQQNVEIFSPPYLFRGPRPTIGSAPAVLAYGASFQVATPDAARIASVSLVAPGSVTHSFNQTQRLVPLAFTASTGSLTVQAPPSGNLAPPGPYMLFLVDTQGVPSVASMVRVGAQADTGPPSVPGSLQAAAAGSSVGLTWSASTDDAGVSGYDVHRSSTSGFTPSAGNRIAQPATTSYTDTPPAPGTYYYKVAARDGSGNVSGPSNQIAATVISGGAPSIVPRQHAGRDAGTTTSASLAFPSANAAGSLIAVAVRAGKRGQSITVSDTRGNTYQRAFQTDLALDTVTIALYYAENVAAGTNAVTVTETLSGGTLRFGILEYAGIAASSALAGTSAMAEGSSGTATSPSVVGTAGSLVLGLFSVSDPATFTASGGATIREAVPAAPSTKIAATDRVLVATGAASATASVSPSQPWAAAVAVFRAASP